MIANNPYTKQITQSAIDYLGNRGITTQTIKEFGIGEALDYLHEKRNMDNKPFRMADKKVSKNPYGFKTNVDPMFINRIMLPIINIDGSLMYSGRAYKKEVLDKYPKYFNSIGLGRSGSFFGIDTYKSDTLHLVEGQMCVLTLHQLGLHAKAVLGNITLEHADRIKYKNHNRVVYYLDTDKSGSKNAFKVGEYLEARGIEVTIAIPPKGIKDVNENKGIDNFTYVGFFEWALETIQKLKPYTREKVFREKMLALPWKNASISLLKKYSYLSKVIDKKIIADKYIRLATHSLENNQTFTEREKLMFKSDNNFLFYLANDMDFIVDDMVNEISYFNNKKTLSEEEGKVYQWLLNIYTK